MCKFLEPVLVPTCAVSKFFTVPSVPQGFATHLQNIENIDLSLTLFLVYLSGKTPPNAGVEVVFLVTVTWV